MSYVEVSLVQERCLHGRRGELTLVELRLGTAGQVCPGLL